MIIWRATTNSSTTFFSSDSGLSSIAAFSSALSGTIAEAGLFIAAFPIAMSDQPDLQKTAEDAPEVEQMRRRLTRVQRNHGEAPSKPKADKAGNAIPKAQAKSKEKAVAKAAPTSILKKPACGMLLQGLSGPIGTGFMHST